MHIYGPSLDAQVDLYRVFIRPTMEYGLAIVPLTGKLVNALDQAQAKVLRGIFAATKTTSLAAMLVHTHLPPMGYRS
ncbi:hypothetical protein GQ42DRAFT_128854, partial [Ramicandelaber brevisporus]